MATVPWNDWVAGAVSLTIAGVTVESIGAMKKNGLVQSRDSRKLTHTATGIVYMMTWPWYSESNGARWICSGVVALLTLVFALVGLELVTFPKLVESCARSGRPSELLMGPLQYGLIHIAFTLIWWRISPAGIIGLACLCAGDGIAAIVGQRLRLPLGSLPYNKTKSYAGSIACFFGGLIASMSLVYWFNSLGYFRPSSSIHSEDPDVTYPTWLVLRGCTICALAAAFVESLPFKDFDNVTMSLAAALMAMWIF